MIRQLLILLGLRPLDPPARFAPRSRTVLIGKRRGSGGWSYYGAGLGDTAPDGETTEVYAYGETVAEGAEMYLRFVERARGEAA